MQRERNNQLRHLVYKHTLRAHVFVCAGVCVFFVCVSVCMGGMFFISRWLTETWLLGTQSRREKGKQKESFLLELHYVCWCVCVCVPRLPGLLASVCVYVCVCVSDLEEGGSVGGERDEEPVYPLHPPLCLPLGKERLVSHPPPVLSLFFFFFSPSIAPPDITTHSGLVYTLLTFDRRISVFSPPLLHSPPWTHLLLPVIPSLSFLGSLSSTSHIFLLSLYLRSFCPLALYFLFVCVCVCVYFLMFLSFFLSVVSVPFLSPSSFSSYLHHFLSPHFLSSCLFVPFYLLPLPLLSLSSRVCLFHFHCMSSLLHVIRLHSQ